MDTQQSLWLVTNAASGSNHPEAWGELDGQCAKAGLCIDRTIHFPEEQLPGRRELEASGIGMVAIFAGDGTTNALVTSLYGWDGAILVLPGGTMNFLYHRLHGDRGPEAAIAAVAAGKVRRCRPDIIRSKHGDALSGLLAGPGTEWNEVREALRNLDPIGVASGTAAAIGKSVAAPTIVCADPALGREEGYPLIQFIPEDGRMVLHGYHSETIEDYLAQGLALLKRDFREGPRDDLGEVAQIAIRSMSGEPIGLLIDGEPAESGTRASFKLARCEVDLLATEFDD